MSRRKLEAYLCSFLDEESRQHYIFGGVTTSQACRSMLQQQTDCRSPPCPVYSSVCIMTMSARRAGDYQLSRTMQGGTPLTMLTPNSVSCRVMGNIASYRRGYLCSGLTFSPCQFGLTILGNHTRWLRLAIKVVGDGKLQ